jgi:hypothetical protein
MRYKDNSTVLCGYLTPNSSVTIKLLNTKTDTLIGVSSNICTESDHISGLYRFDTANITDQFDKLEIAYIMEDDIGEIYGGKIVIEDYNSDIIDQMSNIEVNILSGINDGNQDIEAIIKDVQLGNWEIKDNQMIMKKQSGEELARFNLYDLKGNPSMNAVYKREIVT